MRYVLTNSFGFRRDQRVADFHRPALRQAHSVSKSGPLPTPSRRRQEKAVRV